MLHQWLSSWFHGFATFMPTFRRRRGSLPRPQRQRPRLPLELLEDRCVPSTFIVNELLDTHAVTLVAGTDAGGLVSLRSAIEAADHQGGVQTIQFDPNVFASPEIIKLTLGALYLKGGGDITIQGPAAGVTISGHHASAVLRVAAQTTADLEGLSISNGMAATDGAGIWNGGTLTLRNSTVSGNTALCYASEHGEGIYSYFGSGGGIYNNGALTIDDSTISGNAAQYNGAGIYNAIGATVQLIDSRVTGNTKATGPYIYWSYGGGIDNLGVARLTDCTVSGNRATAEGGGIYNGGTATATLRDCTISGNAAGTGGGVCGYDGATTTLEDCTISGNAATAGAGIAIPTPQYDFEPLSVTNCTITGNVAGTEGGGLCLGADNEATISDSTISGNTAPLGGGIYNAAYLLLQNSIVAGNKSTSGDGDLVGSVEPGSVNNLIGDGSGITGGLANHSNGNQVGTHAHPINPLLAPLGNYGGPTETMALLPGSPAIGAGSIAAIPAGVTTDQRGLPRIMGGTVDVGAFESQGFTLNLVSGANQCASLNGSLSSPLVVAVIANNPTEPVAGGQVTFTAVGGSLKQTIDANGAACLSTLPHSTVAGPCIVTASAAGVGSGDAVSFQVMNNPVVTPASLAVPANVESFRLVIQGAGFDLHGTNSVTMADLTDPTRTVTVAGVTVNSTNQLAVQVSGTFADGDVLAAVVTTDGASSVPTPVAVVAAVLTPTTAAVPANAGSATLVIAGLGFDPNGVNSVTILDRTHPADLVTVSNVEAASGTTLAVTLSGTFTAGDALSAVVTTDGARSAAVPVAVVVPVATPASTFVPARATSATLLINGFGFDPKGRNTVQIADLTHPADKVTVGKTVATSATTLRIALCGTVAAGDVLCAVVTTDGASGAAAAIAIAVQPPAIVSASSARFTVGQPGNFTITTTGFPAAALTEIGVLPAWLRWMDNGNGTATLSGTPPLGAARATPYRFTIRASNGVGSIAAQPFQLFVP